MCGIAGFLDFSRSLDLATVLPLMTKEISHRGPDDEGQWYVKELGLALGHRRLSIIDLSPEGHQPMVSQSGRFVITFNGEIYNFQNLRLELKEYNYRGHSDTEVMLAAFEKWGVEASVPKLSGMFAFAVYDKQDKLLHLYRDRMGEKPLYYGWVNDSFVFASELKSIRAIPNFKNPVSKEATELFFST